MFNANPGYSLADIAAATGCNGNSRNSDMWGDNGAWWIIILYSSYSVSLVGVEMETGAVEAPTVLDIKAV